MPNEYFSPRPIDHANKSISHAELDTLRERNRQSLAERRERIAAMCLQGLLANAGGNADETKMAPMAIKHADALLKALEAPRAD